MKKRVILAIRHWAQKQAVINTIFQRRLFFDKYELDIVYKHQLYERCIHEMQHSLPFKDLSCFRGYDAYRGGNATLRDHPGALLDSGFSRFEVGNQYVRASANSKQGSIYSDNGTFTSILEEQGADYSVYVQIRKFESEIRKNGLWKVVLEMVPEHEQCAVYLRKLWDSVYQHRSGKETPVALACLIYYIVRITLKRMKTVQANQNDMNVNNGRKQHQHLLKDEHFTNFSMEFHATESIDDVITELRELSMMIAITISEISQEVPQSAKQAFSEISISAHEFANTHDSVWSRMQNAPTQSMWRDFKDTLGIKKPQTVVDDMSAEAVIESVHTVHKLQYIYDLSKHEKTELLREYGLLYGPETPTESTLTCQKMMSTHAAAKNPFTTLRYTKAPSTCSVTRGNRLDSESVYN